MWKNFSVGTAMGHNSSPSFFPWLFELLALVRSVLEGFRTRKCLDGSWGDRGVSQGSLGAHQ